MVDWNLKPQAIEDRSMAIIDSEAPDHCWDAAAWSVVRRMVHTSADFDYVGGVRMHPQAMASGMAAIRSGCRIVTDTRMAQAGISKYRLEPFGCTVDCLMSDTRTAELAKAHGTTRAVAAVDLALEDDAPLVWVIGNAPTALFRLLEHIEAGAAQPALVVGTPVGFVNAAESKDALAQADVPFITALGRKGGSNVAASVINALALLCLEAKSHE